MIITGKITAKSFAKAKNGANYATFEVDGKKYNSFDEKIIDAFSLDDVVTITTETNGKYENMVSMVKADQSLADKAAEPRVMPVSESTDLLRKILAELQDITNFMDMRNHGN